MSEISSSWSEEFAGLWEDSGIRYVAEPIGISSPSFENTGSIFPVESGNYKESVESESLKNQVKGFALAWGEILLELGRGCRDIVKQNLITEDSYVQKLRGPCASVTSRLSFLNEFLPEDRDPVYAWPVIFFVSILAFTGVFWFWTCFFFFLIVPFQKIIVLFHLSFGLIITFLLFIFFILI